MSSSDHGFIFSSPLLTPDEAARRLKVSTRTIDDARRAGKIVGTMIGRQYRYTMVDLDDYVARSRADTPAEEVTVQYNPPGRTDRGGPAARAGAMTK